MALPPGFNPKRSYRSTNSAGKDYDIFEAFLFPGVTTVGTPTTGGVNDEYDEIWLVEYRADKTFHYFKQNSDLSWTEQTTNLPVISGLTGNERRVSAAFDQNQRILVCFELGGTVRVTRWNGSNYVQDISFTGVNPTLFAEGLAARYIPGSDVVCFYQKTTDMSKIYTRLSSENFSTEREHHVYSEDIILDKAGYDENDPYRYYLYISDQYGEKIYIDDSLKGLRSELYPLRVSADSLGDVAFKDFVFDNVVYQYFPIAASSSDFSLNSLVFDPTVYLYYPVANGLASIGLNEMTHNQIVQLYSPIAQSLFGVELAASSMQLVTIAYPYNPIANSQASIGLASFIMETV